MKVPFDFSEPIPPEPTTPPVEKLAGYIDPSPGVTWKAEWIGIGGPEWLPEPLPEFTSFALRPITADERRRAGLL